MVTRNQETEKPMLNISIRELAWLAGVDPAVARRAAVDGVFPARNPEKAARLKKALDSLAAEGRGVSIGRWTNGVLHPVQIPVPPMKSPAPVCQPGGAPINATTDEEYQMLLRNESLTQKARQHFNLARNPFADDIHTRADVFLSPGIRYVRAALYEAAVNHGFIAVVGESGAGKSTLAEELEQRILDEEKPVVVIRPYVLAMEENDTKGRTLKSGAIAEAIIRTLDPAANPRRTPEACGGAGYLILARGWVLNPERF
jgi:hypothetical protein